MSGNNEAMEAALDELNKAGRAYRIRECSNHNQIYIDNCKMIITVSCAKKGRDIIIAKKVRADIRRAIRIG